jgi:hypothetical protein
VTPAFERIFEARGHGAVGIDKLAAARQREGFRWHPVGQSNAGSELMSTQSDVCRGGQDG